MSTANIVSNTANTSLPSELNTDESVKVDQKVLDKVPLIVTEESPYTNDVTNKKEE